MMINCPECKKQVSSKAAVCPHCGINLEKALMSWQYRLFMVSLFVGTMGWIISIKV